MHFLGCLIFFFLGIFFIVIALFGNILRVLFGMRKATKNFKKAAENAQKTNQQQSSSRHESSTHHRHTNNNNGKIFSKDEGEYVDFEEIKDE